MYTLVAEHVFLFLRTVGGEESTYAHHMKDARFTTPAPALLVKVVDLIDAVPKVGRVPAWRAKRKNNAPAKIAAVFPSKVRVIQP